MSKLAIEGGAPVRDTQSNPWPKWPPYDEREEKQLLEVLRSHNWGGYPSPNVKSGEFARKFAAYHGADYGICCGNGSVSMEIALRAAGIEAGDEVIVPAYTWIATAACAVFINAVPVFADVRPEDYTLDPDQVTALITPKTKAVISVHLGSSIADNDRLIEICKKHDLIYIEDCAHAHGAKWKDKGVGSWGDFGSFSFQSSKLMTAGEGGLILTSNKIFEEKCQAIVNCGRKEWGYDSFDGEVFGSNYRMSDFQCGVLLAQLEKLEAYTEKRSANAHYLTGQLNRIDGISTLPVHPNTTTSAHYQYIFKYDPAGFQGLHRDKFIEALGAEGVMVDGDFYEPIHERPLFTPSLKLFPLLKERYPNGITKEVAETPVSYKAAYEEACWMHYPYLMGDTKDLDEIVAAIRKVRDNAGELL